MTQIEIKADSIKLVPLKDLKPNPKNRNSHSKEQLERMMKLIEYQGFRDPIIVSNLSGMVVAGHGRLAAAKKLKLSEVPVSYQDFESEDQEVAFGISHNAIAEWSELDFSGINVDLGDLGPDFDVDLLGIKNFTIDVADKEPEGDPNAIPEKVEPKAKLGDIYRLGEHRLMCGDSTNIQHVETLMDNSKADMVFTDPPYGVEYQSNHRKGGKGAKFNVLQNDDKMLDIAPVIFMVAKEAAPVFVWTAHQVYPMWREQFESFYINTIIWVKGKMGMGDLSSYGNDYEMALFCSNGGKPKLKGSREPAVWNLNVENGASYMHPTQKPVSLAEKAIGDFDPKTVLDLFGGSGSTLIACEKTNRKCFMMELDPHYISIIIERWCKYTGEEAYLLHENGQTTSWTEIKGMDR